MRHRRAGRGGKYVSSPIVLAVLLRVPVAAANRLLESGGKLPVGLGDHFGAAHPI